MSPQCKGCGGTVSKTWARVRGDNNNDVWACPDCRTDRELKNGAAAGLDIRKRGLGLGEGRV